MAEFAPQADGSAQVTVTAAETAGLKALAAPHLAALERAERWFGTDIAPELGDAAEFLKTLTASPAEGATVDASAPQVQYLRGLLRAHVPDFQQVLAVVESPVVRGLFGLAEALL
jgi:hypothetical protein